MVATKIKSKKEQLLEMAQAKKETKSPLPSVDEGQGAKEKRREEFYRTEDDIQANKEGWSDVAKMCDNLQKILPEEILTTLRSISDFDNQSAWKIGDSANEIYNRAKSAMLGYTHTDIYYFVSRVLLNESRSLNTIKGYALVAARFSPLVREECHFEDIPFSHFAFSGRTEWDDVNTETGEYKWNEILKLSYMKYIEYGRPVSVRKLRLEYLGINPESGKSTYKTGKTSTGDFSGRMINPTNPGELQNINPTNAKAFVKSRLQVIWQELNGLSTHVVGNIPNFPSSFFSQAIILLGEVIRKI